MKKKITKYFKNPNKKVWLIGGIAVLFITILLTQSCGRELKNQGNTIGNPPNSDGSGDGANNYNFSTADFKVQTPIEFESPDNDLEGILSIEIDLRRKVNDSETSPRYEAYIRIRLETKDVEIEEGDQYQCSRVFRSKTIQFGVHKREIEPGSSAGLPDDALKPPRLYLQGPFEFQSGSRSIHFLPTSQTDYLLARKSSDPSYFITSGPGFRIKQGSTSCRIRPTEFPNDD